MILQLKNKKFKIEKKEEEKKEMLIQMLDWTFHKCKKYDIIVIDWSIVLLLLHLYWFLVFVLAITERESVKLLIVGLSISLFKHY